MSERKVMIRFSKTKDFDEIDYYLKIVIRRAVTATLEYEGFPYDAEVSVTLSDNGYIRALNKNFRNKDKHTDVLSFPLYEDGDFDMGECISGAMLGDIVISMEKAHAQAIEYGHSLIREVAFLATHSTLHLLGYDHETSEEDEADMRRRQSEIMDRMGLSVHTEV